MGKHAQESYVSSNYLTQASASTSYLTQASASTSYLTQASASTSYLTQDSASATYLTQASASTSYLTQASASATYLTQNSASTTYATNLYVRSELTYETTTDLTVSTNSTTMSISTGNVGFVASGPNANWTINFTDVPTTNGQTITATIFVTQGATGYIPATVQIGGVGQTIKWQGGLAPTPTSSSGKIDIFSFSMIRRGSTWTVLGSMLGNF